MRRGVGGDAASRPQSPAPARTTRLQALQHRQRRPLVHRCSWRNLAFPSTLQRCPNLPTASFPTNHIESLRGVMKTHSKASYIHRTPKSTPYTPYPTAQTPSIPSTKACLESQQPMIIVCCPSLFPPSIWGQSSPLFQVTLNP